ncbi:flagellar basal body P-ring formation chaperone FlgA [Rhodovibrionaceae bacterium A322]
MRNILLASTLLPFLLVPGTAIADAKNSQETQAQEEITYPAPVGLNPSVRVQGRIVRLGHLFSGLDEQANTPIARSPELGKSVELTAQWLGAVARAYNIQWTPRSTFDVSRVERASISITATDISPVLLAELDEDGDGDTSNVQLQFDEPNATFLLPEEAGKTFELVAFRKDDRTGRFAATLQLGEEGPNMQRVQLNGQSYEMTQIPVLRHRLEDNDVVEAGDLDWMTVRADRIPQGSAIDQEDIIGKAAGRRLRAGKPIRLSDLGEPVTIHKKSAVTILVDHGLMQLTAQGRAMEDGQIGDLIRVMNIQSNKTVHAIVVDENLVEVNLAAKQLSQLTKPASN